MPDRSFIPVRLIAGLLFFLLTGCNGYQEDERRATVLAYDVCIVGVSVLDLTVFYNDDSATGTVAYLHDGASRGPWDFYIGNFPDRSLLVEESTLDIDNPDVLSATKQRYSDGHFVAAFAVREGVSRKRSVLFRSTKDLSVDPEFLLLAQGIRRCRINEIR